MKFSCNEMREVEVENIKQNLNNVNCVVPFQQCSFALDFHNVNNSVSRINFPNNVNFCITNNQDNAYRYIFYRIDGYDGE